MPICLIRDPKWGDRKWYGLTSRIAYGNLRSSGFPLKLTICKRDDFRHALEHPELRLVLYPSQGRLTDLFPLLTYSPPK